MRIFLDESKIKIEFPYVPRLVEAVKALPDRRWDPEQKIWWLPADKFHAEAVLEFGRKQTIPVETDVARLAEGSSSRQPKDKDRTGLYPFQSEGVDFIHAAKGRCIVADEQGLGKTITSLAYAKENKFIHNVLVVCPASVVYKWQAEIKKWTGWDAVVVKSGKHNVSKYEVIITSYELMYRNKSVTDRMWDLVIGDECFTGDTLVSTDIGDLRIDYIVENKLNVSVMSYNIERNVVQLMPVTGWIKKKAVEDIVRVRYEGGYFDCTESHPIWTEENGYEEAKNVSGKTVLTHTEDVEVSGQKKGRSTKYVRVESVEVLESGSGGKSSGSEEEDRFVYCLDVENNHNFFANGVLVHNCHYVSNKKAIRSRAFARLNASNILLLSGTPFLNRPIELWHLLHIINPDAWPSQHKYALRYCDAFQSMWGWDYTGQSNTDELKRRLEPILLRRLKADVLDQLPALRREFIHVPPETLEEYQQVKSGIKTQDHTQQLETLAKLRQIVGLLKVTPAIELAENVLQSGESVVLYAHHLSVVDLLYRGLKDKYSVGIIQGSVSQQERAHIVEKFQKGETQVMIITSAGGEGIDLYRASSVIFVEREWNSGKEMQAEARLHRIGQNNPVVATYLVLTDTIDEKISKLIESKRSVFNDIIGLAQIETDIRETILKELTK